jgi:bifunctional non-homologous end joining protein LigD
MLASIGDVPLVSPHLVYEPKYDGIRGLVAIEPVSGRGPRVRVWSRLGNEKGSQFPEVVAAIGKAFARLTRPVLVDGEIVALDRRGEPIGFQNLQNRIHLQGPSGEFAPGSVAFIAFDLVFDGGHDLRELPFRDRRKHLDKLFAKVKSDTVRITEQAIGDGSALEARAHADNWEGLIAKQIESRYVSGKRSSDWTKIKLVRQQTCVIGGWTDPRGARHRFGALLLGVYDDAGRLQHVGQVGTGFSGAELERVWRDLQAVKSPASPFHAIPRALARSHWVEPRLVCEVKFTEWTSDDKLRHPTYLGMRDDVKPKSVTKEPQSGAAARPRTLAKAPRSTARAAKTVRGAKPVRRADLQIGRSDLQNGPIDDVLAQLDRIQASGGSGVVTLPDGARLDVTNLGKVFWPSLKLTKGDLMRHYVRVAPVILPALADRPLVMKRYPDGVDAKPFYQHRAADKLPAGIQVATVKSAEGDRPHVIGGSLLALLYTSQLAAISQDPWFSRMGSLEFVDSIAIDLDPPDDTPFRKVLDVALHVRDALASLGATGFAKTSGSRGVHVFVPMPPKTPYEAGLLYAQIIATIVARKHPRQTTIERSIAARSGRIYLDYMQNMRGKTLASVYSVRANAFAGVSTPLTWDEVEAGVSPKDFTMANFAGRLAAVGDLWAGLRRARPADLRRVERNRV